MSRVRRRTWRRLGSLKKKKKVIKNICEQMRAQLCARGSGLALLSVLGSSII